MGHAIDSSDSIVIDILVVVYTRVATVVLHLRVFSSKLVDPVAMHRSRSDDSRLQIQVASSPSGRVKKTLIRQEKKNNSSNGGIGALTISLRKSARCRQRDKRKEELNGGESIQVLNKHNLPLTIALHSDFIEKNHIDKVGILHKDLMSKSQKRLNTKHDKWVIEQWNFAHNRRVPFPEIPLPLTLKRGTSSDGITHFWKTLQTHNQLIKRATNTIDSYLPKHVVKMRQRKQRNRKIILSNHKIAMAREAKRRQSKKKVLKNNAHPKHSSRKGVRRPASAQKRREWKFQDAIVAETLAMYGAIPHCEDDQGLGRGRFTSSDGQQNHAGLSAEYLKSSLSVSNTSIRQGRRRRRRPNSARPLRHRREVSRSSGASSVSKKVIGTDHESITVWASNLSAAEKSTAGIDLLRHTDGKWVGVKPAVTRDAIKNAPAVKHRKSRPQVSPLFPVKGPVESLSKRQVSEANLRLIVAEKT